MAEQHVFACVRSRQPHGSHADGFTLIEMMVAMAILIGGLSAIIALMTMGVSTRFSAAARQEAVWLSNRVFQELAQESLGNPWLDDAPADALQPRNPVVVPEVPGMSYTVEFTESEESPDLVLAAVHVRWSEQGEGQVQIFRRVMPRQDAFVDRARRLQEQRGLPQSR